MRTKPVPTTSIAHSNAERIIVHEADLVNDLIEFQIKIVTV